MVADSDALSACCGYEEVQVVLASSATAAAGSCSATGSEMTAGSGAAPLPTVEVAVVGSGPSALALSAALSGRLLHLRTGAAAHPEPSLARRVGKLSPRVPLQDYSLPPLAMGLRARCLNPLAALVDELL